jgi:hypothetical protein
VVVSSPSRPETDPLVREIGDGLRRIETNYEREGSGPGSRFEGRCLEYVQAEWVIRELSRRVSVDVGLFLIGLTGLVASVAAIIIVLAAS